MHKVKMFKGIRIFSIVLAIIIVLLSVMGGWHIRQYAVTHLVMEPLTNTSQYICDLYYKNVWRRYSFVLEHMQNIPTSEWQALTQYYTLVDISKEYLDARNILKSQIITPEQRVFYDSDEQFQIPGSQDFIKSIFTSSKLAPSHPSITKLLYVNTSSSFINEGKYLLGVAVPIVFPKPTNALAKTFDNVTGFVILYFDIHELYQTIKIFQYFITILLVIVILPILVLLILSSRKVEELLSAQQLVTTELAQAKALAESESKAKSQFLANISHELRTPLNAIIGFSEIINAESMGSLNNDKYKEFVQDIHASGIHLLGLINDLLDFSKAEEDKLQVENEAVDLTKMIKMCLRMINPRAEKAGIRLIDAVPPEHIIITADSKRIKQVLLNLLSNSIKFTPEGGNITIRAWKEEANNLLRLQLKDSGVGMAPQDLARALSPFGQVANQFSQKVEGTGLGLPLTKKLVELMHGSFEIQSELGLGTTVTLTFPLSQELG